MVTTTVPDFGGRSFHEWADDLRRSNPDAYRDLLRMQDQLLVQTSFRAYVEKVCGWKIRPHQEPWIDALQRLADGTLTTDFPGTDGDPTRKLLILSFPSSGKSRTVCQFAQWIIARQLTAGIDPTVGYICYAYDLAIRNSHTVRKPIEESWKAYYEAFPAVPHFDKKKNWREERWTIPKIASSGDDATFSAGGINASTIGMRFDSLIVLDDMLDRNAAMSPTERERAWNVYNDEIEKRGNRSTPIVHISTRFHEDDVPGRLLALTGRGGWARVHTPCLIEEVAEDETAYRSAWPPEVTPEDGQERGRSVDDLLYEREHFPSSFLSQWQALPPSTLGDVFTTIETGPRPKLEDVRDIWVAWDTAEGERNHHDYSACIEAWRLKSGHLFIDNAFRVRVNEIKLIEIQEAQRQRLALLGKPLFGIVEKKSNGNSVALHSTWLRAETVKNKDLVNRAMLVSPFLFSGKATVNEAYWSEREAYITELRGFPSSGNDDFVSATTLLLEKLLLRKFAALTMPTYINEFREVRRTA